MNQIRVSEQEKLDLRKSFIGAIWGMSLIFFEIGDDAAMGKTAWPVSIVAFILASILIFKPRKDWVWLSLGIVVPIQILLQLPNLKNHAAFFAAFSIAVVVAFLTSKFSRKNPTKNWLDRNEPFLRLVFLLGYGAAAIAKLNAGFFDYRISCANSMAVDVLGWLPIQIPFTTFAWLPYLVSATELFVFIGLIFKITRPWALVVAALFHIVLSLHPNSAAIAFNPALYSMLVLFLPTSATQEITFKFREFIYRNGRKRADSLLGFTIVALIATLGFFKFVTPGPYMSTPAFILRITYSLAMVALLIYGAIKFRNENLDSKVAKAPSILAWVTVFVIVLNAASPYLGGKTGATFTMFSNLRVEGGTSNHFLIPRLGAESKQDDLVEVVKTDNPAITLLVDKKEMVTWTTFQYQIAKNPKGSVTYKRNGDVVEVADISKSDILKDYDAVYASLWQYRNIPIKGTCAW